MSSPAVIEVSPITSPVVVEVHIVGPPGPAGTGLPVGSVTARQWQSALAAQGKLYSVRDVIPADANSPVSIQWFACGYVRPPPVVDVLWNFTKSTLAYTDPQMMTLYTLALSQEA